MTGVVITAVWATAYALGSAFVPPGFEGEHLERSLTTSIALAAAGSLLTAALLARKLQLGPPWPFATSGLVTTAFIALCAYAITRQAGGIAGGTFFLTGITATHAALAAFLSQTHPK
jgi:hypothetical protein